MTPLLVLIALLVTPSLTQKTWWKPSIGQSFQWKLSGTFSYTFDAAIYGNDLDNDFNIQKTHSTGRKAICYINVGSLETDPDFRPDFPQFPSSILGTKYPGWDERFLDIRSPITRTLILARLQRAATAGCDAIEPDNTDTYGGETGFPLTQTDALNYVKWLSESAHNLGLGIALKNGVDLLTAYPEVMNMTDFAIVEGCNAIGNCEAYKGFVGVGKPVFAVEYTDDGEGGCEAVGARGVAAACKKLNGLNYEGFVTNCDVSRDVKFCQVYKGGVRTVGGVVATTGSPVVMSNTSVVVTAGFVDEGANKTATTRSLSRSKRFRHGHGVAV
ncbi:glycoside hydrolase superfamily [Chytridium lagenaria]|nr:glycoside hydrolase superfamily [Chytridium lagenaria]